MNIPCNYQNAGETRCWMCGTTKIRTEHYFECSELTNIWNANMEDMTSGETDTLVRASKHLEGVVKRNVLCPYGKMTL